MEKIRVNCIELCGTNYEIGFRTGKLISEIAELKSTLITPINCIDEKDEKQITSLFNYYCPGLNEEIEGFADASKVNKRQILFYANTYLKAVCSQIALLPDITESGHVLLARNYDFNHKMDDLTVSKTKVSGRYAHIGTNVMQFGRGEGLNECGLAVSQSACGVPVSNFPGARKPVLYGLQFWAVVRTLLENCRNVEEALDFLKDLPVACNINLLLADNSGTAILVEIYDNQRATYKIDKTTQQKYLHATNHRHLSAQPETQMMVMSNSVKRYHCIKNWIEKRENITMVDIKSFLLTKYPKGLQLNYFNHNFGTIKSIVFDLNLGKMDICWGGQLSNLWQTYFLEEEIMNNMSCKQIVIEEPTADFFNYCPS